MLGRRTAGGLKQEKPPLARATTFMHDRTPRRSRHVKAVAVITRTQPANPATECGRTVDGFERMQLKQERISSVSFVSP